MLVDSLFIGAGLVLLAIGAEGLVRGASSLALRVGVAPLVVGLTIVAFGTGSPELFISAQAAVTGDSGIALGNVIGSNISNIALVLGVAALIRPMAVRARLVRREVPLMIGATLVLWVLLLDGRLSRWDGLLLVVGALAYTWFAYTGASAGDSPEVADEFDEAVPEEPRSAWGAGLLLAGGLAGLVVGANVLLRGAVSAAGRLGVSELLIGLTVIAIGTSLPELATSVAATLKDQADVAFGNAVGSNTLNIFAVLGVAALIRPFEAQGLRPLDLGALIASAVLVLPLMARGWVLNRWEGGALLAGYVAYIYSLIR